MEITKLTIRLSSENVAFAKAYAKAYGLNVTQAIDRYLRRIRALENLISSPDLHTITGLVPTGVESEAEFRNHQLHKHSR